MVDIMESFAKLLFGKNYKKDLDETEIGGRKIKYYPLLVKKKSDREHGVKREMVIEDVLDDLKKGLIITNKNTNKNRKVMDDLNNDFERLENKLGKMDEKMGSLEGKLESLLDLYKEKTTSDSNKILCDMKDNKVSIDAEENKTEKKPKNVLIKTSKIEDDEDNMEHEKKDEGEKETTHEDNGLSAPSEDQEPESEAQEGISETEDRETPSKPKDVLIKTSKIEDDEDNMEHEEKDHKEMNDVELISEIINEIEDTKEGNGLSVPSEDQEPESEVQEVIPETENRGTPSKPKDVKIKTSKIEDDEDNMEDGEKDEGEKKKEEVLSKIMGKKEATPGNNEPGITSESQEPESEAREDKPDSKDRETHSDVDEFLEAIKKVGYTPESTKLENVEPAKKDKEREGRDDNEIIQKNLVIYPGVKTEGDLVSSGGITIEEDVLVQGSITAEDTITLHDGVKVKGYIVSKNGDVKVGKDCKVEGKITANTVLVKTNSEVNAIEANHKRYSQ